MTDKVFSQLVEAHYQGLYRFAVSLAKNPADAADLTQQTYYLWATKGHTLRDATKAKSWLFTTLYHEFLGTRRRDWRSSSFEDLSHAEQEPADLEVDTVSKLDAPLVMSALQELDPVFSAPLTLFYLKELTCREIAEVLDLPLGTVLSRIWRAKAQLRSILAQKASRGNLYDFPPQTRSQS